MSEPLNPSRFIPDQFRTIGTPRGYQLQLPPQYSFTLLKRLAHRVSPFEVLQRVDSVFHIRAFFNSVSALTSILLTPDPISLIIALTISTLFATCIIFSGKYPDWLIRIGGLFAAISGFPIISLIIGLIAYSLYGWGIVMIFILGTIGSYVLYFGLDFWFMGQLRKEYGFAVSGMERIFLHVFRMQAKKHQVESTTLLHIDEIESEGWKPYYDRFVLEWPQLENRNSFISGPYAIVCCRLMLIGVPDDFA